MVRLGSPQVAQAMPQRSDGMTDVAMLSREIEHGSAPRLPSTPVGTRRSGPAGVTPTHSRVMSVPLCLCGTPLVTDIEMDVWMCVHCGRAFCRDCGGTMARVGGCDMCTVCGMGMCG